MVTLVLVLQITCSIFLIGIILLQKGKGADIGAAFGGASQTVFGSRGPTTFLNRLTIVVAFFFLATSIYLAHAAKFTEKSTVIDEVTKAEKQTPDVVTQPEPATAEATTKMGPEENLNAPEAPTQPASTTPEKK